MRILAFIAVVIFISAAWWICVEQPKREKAYKASIVEIEAEILDFDWVYDKPTRVELRSVDSKEIITIKFSTGFRTDDEGELPRIAKSHGGKKVFLDYHERGEGSVYWFKYGGTGEVKDVLDIKLIQSRDEWIKKQIDSDERPDISEWRLSSLWTHPKGIFKIESLYRFKTLGSNIHCRAYYDITQKKPVLIAMEFVYSNKDWKEIARNVWIKEDGDWKLYRLGDEKRYMHVFKEDGKVKSELR